MYKEFVCVPLDGRQSGLVTEKYICSSEVVNLKKEHLGG